MELVFLLIIPVLAFTLAIPAAHLLARARSPITPRDGTTGPWCTRCRHTLASLADSAPCPECGGIGRFSFPDATKHMALWVLGAFTAMIFSHSPTLVGWLLRENRAPVLWSPIAAGAFFTAAIMLMLAKRVRGRLLWISLAILIVPQIACDAVLLWLDRHPSKDFGLALWTVLLGPTLRYLIAPTLFIAFALIGSWMMRQRRLRAARPRPVATA